MTKDQEILEDNKEPEVAKQQLALKIKEMIKEHTTWPN